MTCLSLTPKYRYSDAQRSGLGGAMAPKETHDIKYSTFLDDCDYSFPLPNKMDCHLQRNLEGFWPHPIDEKLKAGTDTCQYLSNN